MVLKKFILEYVDLVRHGKSSGRVLLSMEYQGQGMMGNNNGWGQPQNSGWGQPPNSGWGQPPNSGWGQPQSNWGPPPNSGWGQPPNSGWNQPPNSGWGQPPNSGWGQPPNSGWNQPQSNWGNQPQGPVTFVIKPIEANLLKDVDIVILNAGIAMRSFVHETDMHVYQSMMDVNYFGNVRIALDLMNYFRNKKSGKFVVINLLSLSNIYNIKLKIYTQRRRF